MVARHLGLDLYKARTRHTHQDPIGSGSASGLSRSRVASRDGHEVGEGTDAWGWLVSENRGQRECGRPRGLGQRCGLATGEGKTKLGLRHYTGPGAATAMVQRRRLRPSGYAGLVDRNQGGMERLLLLFLFIFQHIFKFILNIVLNSVQNQAVQKHQCISMNAATCI